jgi:hypothetical protein
LLRSEAGIAYVKSYALHKEIFATPLKKKGIFDNPAIALFAYDKDLTQLWFDLACNGKGYGSLGKPSGETQHRRLEESILQCKKRVSTALTRNKKHDFGHRSEVRRNHAVALNHVFTSRVGRIDLAPYFRSARSSEPEPVTSRRDSNSTVPTGGSLDPVHDVHLKWYILPTEVVNEFIRAQLDRFLLPIEVMHSKAKPELGLDFAFGRDRQIMNGQTLRVIAAILKMMYYSHKHDNRIWKKKWIPRATTTTTTTTAAAATAATKPSSSHRIQHEVDNANESNMPRPRNFRAQEGLNQEQSFIEVGRFALRSEQVDWNGPLFHPRVVNAVGLLDFTFRTRTRKSSEIQHDILKEGRLRKG